MDKFIGKRLDGKYEIHDLLGVGGMAYVYRAYDRVEDRWVAIKILKEEFSDNSDFLRGSATRPRPSPCFPIPILWRCLM